MKKRCHGGPFDGREVEVREGVVRHLFPGPGMREGLGHDGMPTLLFEITEYRVDGDRLVYFKPDADAPTIVEAT